MTQTDKLVKKLYKKPTPNDITFDEIVKVAKAYGCTVKKGGNHQYSIVHKPSGTVIPIPQHGKCVKEAYVQEITALLDAIKEDT